MGCRRTDCVERPLSRLFEKLGRLVGTYPIGFFIVPLVVSAILGGGFYFIHEREDNDIERQFTPQNGPSKKARDFIREHFPTDISAFSGQRLYNEGYYAIIIAVADGTSNIMTKEAFEDIIKLDSIVKKLSVAVDRKLTFDTLCSKANGACVPNDLLEIIDYNASKIPHMDITFPVYISPTSPTPIFLGSSIGGVRKKGHGIIDFAKAVKLVYFLDNCPGAEAWLQLFQETFFNDQGSRNIKVFHYTSQSKQEEIEELTSEGVTLFSITYTLAINFSVISCLRLDNVRNKVWVATIGVVSAGLAVLSSFGLMLYIGVPFVMTVANSPFLILGIGVDDMFIMVSNWQRTNVHDPVPTRMAHTYKEAAMSITITTLTDVLGFYIGLMSDFPSVQYFCLYTSTALLFCYVYNVTFFGAFLALNGRREERKRHWLTCMEVLTVAPPKSSSCYILCCTGGDFDKETGAEKIPPVNDFFKHYGQLLTKPWAKAVVILMYTGYLAGSIYGCFHVEQGIDLRDLAADDSYVIDYYQYNTKYFSNYGPNVMLVVTEPFPYWDKAKRLELQTCTDDFKKLDFVSEYLYTSWLDDYLLFGSAANLNLKDKRSFMDNLPKFFQARPEYKQDVNILGGNIRASRFFIQTIHIANSSMERKIMEGVEEKVKACAAAPLLTFHPAFIYYDQYAVIVPSTALNIGVTTAVMLVVSLLLIPNPLCSLWVTFSIGSVIVGVTGFMALWAVKLDTISMIILVVCIGFTVDFSAHISYCFVSSQKPTADGKIVEALFILGYPIMQGALSTILGVVVLAASKSHIFRTFFKIMTLVMVFGLVHGITFLPVFLTLFACGSSEKGKEKEKQEVKGGVVASNVVDGVNWLDNVQYGYDNNGFRTQQGHRNMIRTQNLYVHRQQPHVYVIGNDPRDCP